MSIHKQLPDGWQWVTFGDIAKQLKEDADPESGELERYVAGEHMNTDDLRIRSWGTIGDGYLGPAFHRRFRVGQILYGSRRTYLRKVAIADFDGICANTTFVIEAKSDVIYPDLLPFIMQSEGFTEHSIRNSKGSVNPYINWKDIASYQFPLPPLDEQRRIAEILWAAEETSELHQEVLKSISITADAIIEEHFRAGQEKGSEKLFNYCQQDGIQIGPFGSQLHASDYTVSGIPVIMPADMINGRVDTSDIATISEETAKRLEKHKIEVGDILLPRRGDLDKRVLITKIEAGWITGTGSIRIRPKPEIDAKLLFHILSSRPIVRWLKRHAVGTTMPNLNTTIVSDIPIFLPDNEDIASVLVQLEKLETIRRQLLEHMITTRTLRSSLLISVLKEEMSYEL